MEFNKLERAILDWYKSHYQNDTLNTQIDSAIPINRKWTEVGFYIDLQVDTSLAAVPPMNGFEDGRAIMGPHIESSQIEDGGGVLLFVKDGHLEFIEMYSFGARFEEHISDFKLNG